MIGVYHHHCFGGVVLVLQAAVTTTSAAIMSHLHQRQNLRLRLHQNPHLNPHQNQHPNQQRHLNHNSRPYLIAPSTKNVQGPVIQRIGVHGSVDIGPMTPVGNVVTGPIRTPNQRDCACCGVSLRISKYPTKKWNRYFHRYSTRTKTGSSWSVLKGLSVDGSKDGWILGFPGVSMERKS